MASGLATGTSFVRYQQQAQCHGHSRVLPSFMADVLLGCKDLFQRNLFGHYGCVNAIEFSNKGGAFLVSGGDDRRVLMWNLNEVCAGLGKPWCMRGEHISNIFCTVFDNSNTHIFSGGNDEQVFRHDVQTKETVGMYFHDEAVYGISVHPESDEVFVTACDDGRVLIWDTRSTEPSVLTTQQSAFHAAVFNPVEPYLIATANSSHGVALWDSRVPARALMNYGSRNYNCAMGVKFNSLGTHLTVLGRRLPPVLYRLERPTPLMEFHHPGYINSCTMKSSCFAGNNDQYIVSGSDDFNVYIWKVPEVCDPRSKPVIVNRAHLVLQGHRSIVNQVRFNPHTHTLCTAGVEKVIKVWSPYRMPGCAGDISQSPQHTKRDFFSHQDYIEFILESGRPLGHEYDEQSQEEDPRMLAFFDSLIQREQSGSSSDSDDSLLSTGESYLRFVNEDSSDSSDNDRRGMNADRLRELILRPRGESSDAHINHRVTLRRLRKLATAFMLREISDTSSDSSAAESAHEEQSLELRLRSLSESAKPSTSSFDPLEVRGSTPELNQNGSCVHGIKAKFRNFRRVKRRYRGQTIIAQQPSTSCSSSDEEDCRDKSLGCSVADSNCATSAENTTKRDDENAAASQNLEQLAQKHEKAAKKMTKKKKKVKGKCAQGNRSGETSKASHHNNGANSEDKTKGLLNSVEQSTTESSTSSSESEEERRKLTIISKRLRSKRHNNTGEVSSNSSSSEDSLLSGQNSLDLTTSSSSSDETNDLPNTLDEGPWVKRHNHSKHRRRKRSHRDSSQPLLRKYSRSPRRRPNGSSVEDDRQ